MEPYGTQSEREIFDINSQASPLKNKVIINISTINDLNCNEYLPK